MLFFQTIRVLFVTLIVIMIALILPGPASASRTEHHAKIIINCTNNSNSGQTSCVNNVLTNKAQGNNLLPPPTDLDKKEVKPDKEILPTINEIANQPKEPKTNQLNSFFLGAIGSFTGIGGLMLVGWGAKKLFPTLEVKELKERIEVLETIVTKE